MGGSIEKVKPTSSLSKCIAYKVALSLIWLPEVFMRFDVFIGWQISSFFVNFRLYIFLIVDFYILIYIEHV